MRSLIATALVSADGCGLLLCVWESAGSLISRPCIACAVLFQVWRPPTRGPDSTLKRQGEEKLPTWARRESNGGKQTALTPAVNLIHVYAAQSRSGACYDHLQGHSWPLLTLTGAQAVLFCR